MLHSRGSRFKFERATVGGCGKTCIAFPAFSPFGDDEGLSSLWNWIMLLIFVIVVLLGNIALQIARLRGIEFLAGIDLNKINARLMWGFFVFGAIGSVWSSFAYSPYYLAANSASAHGAEIDQLFWISMSIVFAVFILVNGVLFWFAYKYGKDGDRKAKYYPVNHKLQMIWTVVPAVVLAVLIIFGIKTWTTIMTPPGEGDQVVKVEVSGQQWGWTLRYPGKDANFGDVDVRRIGGDNILGVDMEDKYSADDYFHDSLVVPKGAVVDLKIRSRDVLHSVYLPHFRVKMDAVPGMDTRFHFIPTKTTAEFRELLKSNEYWGQIDTITSMSYKVGDTMANGQVASVQTTVTDTVRKADSFDYELACAEVCGRGHFSMRRVVVVMEPAEYEAWKARAEKSTIASSMGLDLKTDKPNLAGLKETPIAAPKSILE